MSPARPSDLRRRPTMASCSRDLAMLRIAPIGSLSLPRAHDSRRQAMGSIRLHDRPSGEDVIVYTPMFRSQFDAGHRSGRWYIRATTSVGGSPSSVAFSSAKEAVDAVARGAWRLRVIGRDAARSAGEACGRRRLRVIWDLPDLQS